MLPPAVVPITLLVACYSLCGESWFGPKCPGSALANRVNGASFSPVWSLGLAFGVLERLDSAQVLACSGSGLLELCSGTRRGGSNALTTEQVPSGRRCRDGCAGRQYFAKFWTGSLPSRLSRPFRRSRQLDLRVRSFLREGCHVVRLDGQPPRGVGEASVRRGRVGHAADWEVWDEVC